MTFPLCELVDFLRARGVTPRDIDRMAIALATYKTSSANEVQHAIGNAENARHIRCFIAARQRRRHRFQRLMRYSEAFWVRARGGNDVATRERLNAVLSAAFALERLSGTASEL